MRISLRQHLFQYVSHDLRVYLTLRVYNYLWLRRCDASLRVRFAVFALGLGDRHRLSGSACPVQMGPEEAPNCRPAPAQCSLSRIILKSQRTLAHTAEPSKEYGETHLWHSRTSSLTTPLIAGSKLTETRQLTHRRSRLSTCESPTASTQRTLLKSLPWRIWHQADASRLDKSAHRRPDHTITMRDRTVELPLSSPLRATRSLVSFQPSPTSPTASMHCRKK